MTPTIDTHYLDTLCLRCTTSKSDTAATAITIPAIIIKLKEDVGAVIVPKGWNGTASLNDPRVDKLFVSTLVII
jgi:hypothetical protein